MTAGCRYFPRGRHFVGPIDSFRLGVDRARPSTGEGEFPMRDIMDEVDASVENALSLVVLLVISVLVVALAATSVGGSSPAGQQLSSATYPIKIAMGWQGPFESGRGGGPNRDRPAATGKPERPAGLGDADPQAALASQVQANSDPTAEDPAVGASRLAGPSANAGPFIVSDFNLGSGPSAANAIEVRKPVLLNGHAAGTVRVRIDAAAEVYVRQDDIARLLAGKAAFPQSPDQDFIALDRLRERGIDVRYSAGQDALVIST
ncbi:MAG TPA: hypothetical protein VL331_05130 [Croceibacterium sp.]|nr:hypothetical protein [Croceibacterium sp.]